jgi:membrane protein required for colicin V production
LLKSFIIQWGLPEQGVTIVSYIFGFLLIVGVLLLAGEIMHRVIGVTPLSVLNHLGGGLFGLLMMLLFTSLLLNLLEIIDPGSVLLPIEVKVESRLYHFVKEIIPTVYPRGWLSFFN